MNIFDQLPREPLPQPCALTIGTFDGVHRGHAALMQTLHAHAQQRGLSTAVLTFRDLPYCYFFPEDCPRLLTLPEEKTAAFSSLAIDTLHMVPFDSDLAGLEAESFVHEVLVQRLGMKLLVAGPDFALGRNRTGDVTALRAMGQRYGFEVIVLDAKLLEAGEPISSTRIRQSIERGDVTQAVQMLGSPFSFAGEVVSGQQLGRTIGVPTINLRAHPRKVLPAIGVYAVRAFFGRGDSFEDTPHPAALSIGTRPTVDGQTLSIEFHVIDEEIPTPPVAARLEVVQRLRDEEKFPSLDALVTQMQRDIARAREILLQ